MMPPAGCVEIDTPAGLVASTGQVVYVRPYGTLYGVSPAVVRYLPEVGQWSLGYLAHDERRVKRLKLFKSPFDILDKMCIMLKP